jgi:hypothetical protein
LRYHLSGSLPPLALGHDDAARRSVFATPAQGAPLDTRTFESLVTSGAIEQVTIFRAGPHATWQVFAYGDGIPATETNAMELDGGGGRRSWADLNAAHGFIRKHGYRQVIAIDEGTVAP